MAIQVTCPGCLKRFQVNDKFAGKTGPCPNCSKPIKIPEKADEVVIHAPESEGPKDTKGRPVFKPIRRQEVKVSLPVVLGAAVGAMLCVAIALIVRFSNETAPTALLVAGAILLAPPLAYFGYWFLHDDESEGYTGMELITRGAICAVIFMITWGLYALIPGYLHGYESLAEIGGFDLILIIPVMILIGTVASVLALELEITQGILHYLLYFSITLILAVIMGAELASPLARDRAPSKLSRPPAPANATQSNSAETSARTPKTEDEKRAPIKILQ